MTKEKIESVCRAVEIYIQSSAYYKECIIGGNFSGRFDEFLNQEICNEIVRQHEKLLSQLKESEYQNGNLSGKVSDLVRYISDLDEDFKKEDARNNELNDKVSELELGIGVLEGNLDAAQERIGELEEELQKTTQDRDSAASSWNVEKGHSNELIDCLDGCLEMLESNTRQLKEMGFDYNSNTILSNEMLIKSIQKLVNNE